ncbi:uncharacterized protein LOC123037683 [Drosophila rhopaloa]|uniref:Uncharacterized protein n=1 Tax=Drosophila rhopaloa TaxID=1041015 RepID=A0ABM5J913_DRORH|nr:uncharacterized protein LOC123037683 [Drosophila rhopaloa]
MNNIPIILAAVQQQNLKLIEQFLTLNSGEKHEEELEDLERIFSGKEQMPRSVWMLKRYGTFWEKDVQENNEMFFKESFRMEKRTFSFLPYTPWDHPRNIVPSEGCLESHKTLCAKFFMNFAGHSF